MPRITERDRAFRRALREARLIGQAHGEYAYRDWAALMTDLPLPEPDLSGEWADGYPSTDLMRELFGSHADDADVADLFMEACDVYEGAFRAEVDRLAAEDGREREAEW